jgi:hypothetical protein
MSKFSTNVAWWAFNLVNQYSDLNFQLINKDVRVKAKQIEDEGQQRIGKCEALADKATDELAAAEALTSCSNQFAEETVAEWWAYAFSLFAKFGRYAITSNETEQGEVVQRYPKWWLENPQAGFVNWSPDGNSQSSADSDHAEPLQSISGNWPLPVHMFVALTAVGVVAIAVLAHQWGVHRGAQDAKRGDLYALLV